MKILVTGCTGVQVGREPRLGNAPLVRAVCAALANLNHVIENRVVTPGEDLSEYDRVIVYLTPALALGSRYLYGALWALATHPRALVSVDDWRLRLITYNARSVMNDPEKRLWGFTGHAQAVLNRPEEQRQAATKNAARRMRLERVMQALAEPVLPWPLGMPMFPWGDAAKFPLASRASIHAYDPSPYCPIALYDGETKMKRWLLPAASDHWSWLQKQKLRWPVDYYGGTRLLAKTHGLVRVQENEMVTQIYPRYAAAICPPYDHAGAGWWRPRYLHAAYSCTVLAGTSEEMGPIGPEYMASFQQVERMSLDECHDLAVLQKKVLDKMNVFSERRFHYQLMGFLSAG